MKLNVDFGELYKAAEAMGAQPVEIALKFSEEESFVDRAGDDDLGLKNDIHAQPVKQSQNKST